MLRGVRSCVLSYSEAFRYSEALGSESQTLDTSREVSTSEAVQEPKQQMRNGWNGEPPALKVVEKLNNYEENAKTIIACEGLGHSPR